MTTIVFCRSVLYLLYLLLSKEIKRLKVTLCCYYGCRDMEGVMRCIKKNGTSLEHLELSRGALLRMDPLLFRNVLTSASSLTSLVVKNVCSDAMLKLIGNHCPALQYLDISNSKQVSDMGIESLCCQVQIRDKVSNDSADQDSCVSGNLGGNSNSGSSGNGEYGNNVGNGGGAFRSVDSTAPGAPAFIQLAGPMQGGMRGSSSTTTAATVPRTLMTVQEDFGDGSGSSTGCHGADCSGGSGVTSLGCGGSIGQSWGSLRFSSWKEFRQRVTKCLSGHMNGGSGGQGRGINDDELNMVEVKQVLHPVCSTLRIFDIADTSVTNYGLLTILRKMPQLHSLGEFSISDNFLRSLCVVTSLKMDKFGLYTLHARKISNVGVYNMVHVFPHIRAFTCWEPQFDIADMNYFVHLRQLTLLRIPFTEVILNQILRYIECHDVAASNAKDFNGTRDTGSSQVRQRQHLEKICLEFVMQDDFAGGAGGGAGANGGFNEFNLARIFKRCKGLKIFTVEFKDGLMVTPPVSYVGPDILPSLSSSSSLCKSSTALDTLVHVQLGQSVQNSAISTILSCCPSLRHIHCNRCPDLQDIDLAASVAKSINREGTLECFYVYEAPQLTFSSFQLLIESFPGLQRFGNLTRWAVDCEGIQQV